ncbi:MAG: type I restriction enzyme HsdR N-terminal domain-containing protein [Paludibacteraceae bacterium]|nr:type I restriction enzyme HsdR N-terminal domain-containing protein [Paludibacteraceae bacterium]MBR4712447.1 type I restriction enzyme HsdR N-terminal domain-containing protein [Paludibacteraceae bacterium]MBR5375634.1 type I restriction enzyme HsdR N-terminal domain-containing protein [Paludibacteraceae bacterium]
MLELNLPKYSFRIKEMPDGLRIFDRCRGKFVALTPEEWVRQNMVEYLIQAKNFPAARIGNEVTVVVNGMRKRSDTVIYDKEMRARVIVEYKAPTVKITPKVFDQIANYNFVLNVDVLIVSNGLEHYCCRMDGATKKYVFLRDIPEYQSLNW